MPRRNQRRDDSFEPLDLTPADVTPIRSTNPFTRTGGRTAEQVRREAADRQRIARQNQGIDWTVCLVPGCGSPVTWFGPNSTRGDVAQRDHRYALPMCLTHLLVVRRQTDLARDKDHELVVEAFAKVIKYREDKDDEVAEQRRKRRQADTNGHIYFVRLNGIVKAGWTRDLEARFKQYGASVEVLAHYPGTRDDETNLHRQLRPALVRGREWYDDGPLIQSFIRDAIERHGAPSKAACWTEPKQSKIRPRARR